MELRQVSLTTLNAAALAPLMQIRPDVILVFAAPRFFTEPGLAETLASAFPKARRIGASTAGEISGHGVDEDSLVVTAVRFERITTRIATTDLIDLEDCHAAGRRLGEGLAAPDLRGVILLSQGVGVNGSKLIDGAVSALGPTIPLTGGLAGDNGTFSKTWTLLDERISGTMLVALGLYGDAVDFAHGSFGGWQSFGPARRATRADGNVLYELDGTPALEIYKRYLGEHARDLPASGLLFPFAVLSDERQETGLIRTLLAVNEDDGSLVLAGDIPENAFLRLMHASTEALVDGAELAAVAARRMVESDTPSLGLLISCVGRKLAMGDRVEEEIEAVGSVFGPGCTLAGFYSNGEISPFLDSTECKLHNETMTVTYITEKTIG